MLVISATVGGGSTFIGREFKKHGWKVCVRSDKFLRSDVGLLKKTALKNYKERAKKLVELPDDLSRYTNRQLCSLMYQKLSTVNYPNVAMVCMSWGGLGYLKDIGTKPIYIIRHPLFAFNSYSGGGWRKTSKRTKGYGEHLNDWVDVWLDNRSHWIEHAQHALTAQKRGKGYIVRYENFATDWQKIPLALPPIHEQFEFKDNMGRVKKNLPSKTIQYVISKTGKVWDEVKSL